MSASPWVDLHYLQQVGLRLPRFHQANAQTWVFRCPICGDSKKKESKCRGYIYQKPEGFSFHCFNCEASMRFSTFLKKIAPDLHRQYILDTFSDIKKTVIKAVKTIVTPDKKALTGLPRISELPDEHPAKMYCLGRQLPTLALEHLFYAKQFMTWMRGQDYEASWLEKDLPDDDRLILPWYSTTGTLQGFQARSLAPNTSERLRYLTVKATEDAELVYGMDRIQWTQPIHIVEGPIDSWFLPNTLAAMTSDLVKVYRSHVLGGRVTLVWDNEPRNLQIVSKVEKAIDADIRVVIWPKSVSGYKDLNDMVRGGVNVEAVVKAHTFSGLRAKLEFRRWRSQTQ